MNKWAVTNDATMWIFSSTASAMPTRGSSGDFASSDDYSENFSTIIILCLAFFVATIKTEKLEVSGNLFGELEGVFLGLLDLLAYFSSTQNV
jgi:hypothetical protein